VSINEKKSKIVHDPTNSNRRRNSWY